MHWGLGSFGQLHVRHGKGSRRRGPRARVVPLINDARPLLEWYVRDDANGQGEMPYPPEYPKMPGEPLRVQPSRAKDRH